MDCEDKSGVTKSSAKFRANFDYVLNNIQRMRASKKLEILQLDFDSYTSSASNQIDLHFPNTHQISHDLDESLIDDNDVDEINLKTRGEEDIKQIISEKQFKETMDSLNKIKSLREINFQQIICLIKSFEPNLREISCDQNKSSYFAQLYKNCGIPGIAANIQMSLLTKSQKSYILGCLYGLFPNDQMIGQKVFGVLFPETLVRMVMNIKQIDYEMALDLLKPNINTINTIN